MACLEEEGGENLWKRGQCYSQTTALDSSLRIETCVWQERTVPPLTQKVGEEDQTKPEKRLMALTKRHGSSRSQGPAHEHILFLVPGTHSAEPLPCQHGDVLSSPESPSTGNFSPCSTLVTLFWALSRTHALSHWLSQEGEGLSPWAVSRSWGWPVLTDGKADLPRPCRCSNMRAPPQPALTQSKLEVS